MGSPVLQRAGYTVAVAAAAGRRRAAALPVASAAAGRADPRRCSLTSSTGLAIQPHLRKARAAGSGAGQPGRADVVATVRRVDDLRHRCGRGRHLERSAGRGARSGMTKPLLRRQSRRAGLHDRRAPDPDGVLPDQVRQAAALRDLLCRLERPAQRAHSRPRSRLCRLPPAEPDQFAEGAPDRRLACHDLAAADDADALRQRPCRHGALLRRSLRPRPGERRRSRAGGALRAQHPVDLGHQPRARRRHDLGRPACSTASSCKAMAATAGCRWCATATSGRCCSSFNAILERTAKALGDIYVAVPPDSFTGADFVDNGHFSAARRAPLRRVSGARRARGLPLGARDFTASTMPSIQRVILITGASSGIGAATARALAAPNTAIVLHARKNRAGAEKVADVVRGAGAETLILEGDLASRARPAAWSTRPRPEVRPARRRGQQCGLRRPPADRRGRSCRLGCQHRVDDLGLLRIRDRGQAVAGQGRRGRPHGRRVVLRGPCLCPRPAELSGLGRGQGRRRGAGPRLRRRDRAVGRHGQLRGAGTDRKGRRRPCRPVARPHGRK